MIARYFLLLIFLVVLTASAAMADEVHLRDNRVLDGRVESSSSKTVVFRRLDGKISFPRSQVVKIVDSPSVFDCAAQRNLVRMR